MAAFKTLPYSSIFLSTDSTYMVINNGSEYR
jgi:hypothetical protein